MAGRCGSGLFACIIMGRFGVISLRSVSCLPLTYFVEITYSADCFFLWVVAAYILFRDYLADWFFFRALRGFQRSLIRTVGVIQRYRVRFS